MTKVFDVVSGSKCQHRDVMMSDVLRSVIVKFWNDHIPTVTCASSLNVRNLSVSKFLILSECHKTITDETVIEIGDMNDEIEKITFVDYEIERTNITIITYVNSTAIQFYMCWCLTSQNNAKTTNIS